MSWQTSDHNQQNKIETLERFFEIVNQTVAVDFDGVLHPYTAGWCGSIPADEPPMEGAEGFLRELRAWGCRIIVFSTRADHTEGHNGIVDYLVKHDLMQFIADVTHTKPPAIAYVDDRAVRFKEGNWIECLESIRVLGHGHAGMSA